MEFKDEQIGFDKNDPKCKNYSGYGNQLFKCSYCVNYDHYGDKKENIYGI